jgi:NADP-dependent aldehyde dehydrogenase
VAVFGPNNFPFAFNAMLGGDFAAALAAGNPVIAKAHPGHLSTTRLLAQAASEALSALDLPPASVQLIYALPPELGLELVAHPELGATAFTGSRRAGLRLKAAADRAGKPIYLELSAVNPVFVLPGALRERSSAIARELSMSCTMGSGQFCTKPGVSVLIAGSDAETFRAELGSLLGAAATGTLFAAEGGEQIQASLALWTRHGAHIDQGGKRAAAPAFGFENTLASVSGKHFLEHSDALQTEAFGPVHLLVLAESASEMESIAARLRSRVGRLLNDKMPTGVAVSPAMNHGGPYPATGHPGFTSVGLPASILRFTALHSYDQVREPRLPPELRDRNPDQLWRRIDGQWTQADVSPKAS